MPTNQMSVTCVHRETVDYYHHGNLFLPLWKLLFTTIEDIVNVWLHLNSLL